MSKTSAGSKDSGDEKTEWGAEGGFPHGSVVKMRETPV